MGYKKIRYTGIRRNISQYVLMVNRIPLTHETSEVRISGLREFCSRHGVTYTPVFMKVIAAIREKYPIVNSFVARDITLQKKIFILDEVDLSLAVEKCEDGAYFSTHQIIQNVNKKSILELSSEIKELSSMPYRKLPGSATRNMLEFLPDFLKYILIKLTAQFSFFYKHFYGTVGMSNLGKYGIKNFDTLFINNFGYAIGGIEEKPVMENGELKVVPVVHITQTSNHLVVDGAESARVLAEFKRIFESGEYSSICEP